MSRIVVSGYYGSKNAGDEAMLAAMIEIFSRLDPQVNITVISANPADTKKRHGVGSVPLTDIVGIARAIKKADILISGGGSLLQNVTSVRSLYYYLGIIFLSCVFRTPVMLYAQGIGPIYGAAARRAMKILGNRVDMITVRDHGSLEELVNLGITKPKILATADPVLAINPADKKIGEAILKEHGACGEKPIIGIAVREWRGWKHYKEVFAAVTKKIIAEFDANVVFLPMQFPEDVEVAKIIAADAGESCTVLDGEYTTAELLSLVGNMELMLSIRLHALIFAGVMGVPMVGVSYDPKIDRFLDSIGEKPAGDLSGITVEELMTEMRRKWRDKQKFRQKNAALLKKLHKLAVKNAKLAMEIINRKK